MQLAKYRPRQCLTGRANNRSNHFDSFLDDFFTPFVATATQKNLVNDLNLKVDIYEMEDTVIIDAELPGVEKDNIFVDTKGRLVTLGGERKNDNEINEKNSYRRERRYGKFERTFSLPFEVNVDNVKATFNNGILKLEIPKPVEEKAKKITIQ